MDALAALCSECSSLASVQLRSADGAVRLRCLCAMFVGMKDNVLRVQQGVENNTCSVTNRMTEWATTTVREARALIKKLKEEPRQLNFFEKRFLSFCVSLEKTQEQNEKLDERLDTLLCRAFVIQIAVSCEEETMVVDVMPDSSAQTARQEFLGCVFDLKGRIANSAENSDQAYKRVVFQISEEYQTRQDERTAAGKRAFIRWHKAAKDMIKLQLQQKLSERERAIQAKDEQVKEMTSEVERLVEANAALEAAAGQQQSDQNQKTLEELQLARKENEELKQALDGKSSVEKTLEGHGQRVIVLETQIKEKESEANELKKALEEVQQKSSTLEKSVADIQVSEKVARDECKAQQEEIESLRVSLAAANENSSKVDKVAAERLVEIATLKEQIKAADELNKQNGASSEEVARLQKQLREEQNKFEEANSTLAAAKKENSALKEQVKAKQTENTTINQSISRMVEERNRLQAESKDKEKTMKNYEQELKALKEQLKELQEKEVQMLEQNVDLEETCRGLQEQISQKEQEIMNLENKANDIDEEMKRALEDKTEQIESLERRVKRLTNSLDNTKKDLQAKKAELEELQNKA